MSTKNVFEKRNSSNEYIGIQKKIVNQVRNLFIGMGSGIFAILIFSIIISLIFVLDTIFNEVKKMVLLLKVMGYKKRTINFITIFITFVPLFIGWVLSVGTNITLINLFVYKLINKFDVIVPIGYGLPLIPITFGIIILIFIISYSIFVRRIYKSNVSELTREE